MFLVINICVVHLRGVHSLQLSVGSGGRGSGGFVVAYNLGNKLLNPHHSVSTTQSLEYIPPHLKEAISYSEHQTFSHTSLTYIYASIFYFKCNKLCSHIRKYTFEKYRPGYCVSFAEMSNM